jgi:hypothetical protein
MLPWSDEVGVHRLGLVDTLLISRPDERSEALRIFEQIILAPGAELSASVQ